MRKFYVLFLLCLLAGRICSQVLPPNCVENEITYRYLRDFSYDTIPDYNISYVRDYAALPHDYRLDAPKPILLTWTKQAGADAQRVEISEFSTYADSLTYVVDKDTSAFEVYNLIPGVRYYYRIVTTKSGDESVTFEDDFETTGQLRMLYAPGTLNVRDIGGWKGLGGHPIKYGKIFRGARLSENSTDAVLITAEGKAALRNAGIRAELDLRQDSESGLTISPLSEGGDVDYKRVSNSVNARMNKLDAADANIVEVQWVIDELRKNKPVYYHCSMGADRTGTLGFILGALFGMSVDDLTKDYELTTFCAPYTGEDGFARIRYSKVKLGSPSSDWEPYTLYPLIQKMQTMSGSSYQRKIYNFLKNGVNGKKISEADLDWLIKEMVDYVLVKNISVSCATTLNRLPGDTDTIKAVVQPANATNKTLSYKSSDTLVAKVTANGIIMVVGRGKATITVRADDMTKNIYVDVPLVESTVSLPDTVKSDGRIFVRPATLVNLIKNGSFEYGHHFLNWTAGNEKELTSAAFEYKSYAKGDSVYLQSKADGDSASYKSIRTMWKIEKGKSYVFGYRVKNSTDKQSVKNPYLATSLVSLNTSLDGGIDDFGWDDTPNPSPRRTLGRSDVDSLTFEFPTYGSEWTDVQYAFTNTDYQYIQVWFTHLSQGGNNTCLDNFYLCEMTDVTGVRTIRPASSSDDKIYNLAGQEVVNPGRGIYIRNGKKYIIK